MNASSFLLTPPAVPRQESSVASHLTSSPLLVDVVPFEASLQRLLYEKVSTDEQMCSYSVQQAYRGLLYGVRATTLTLTGAGVGTMNHESALAPSKEGATQRDAALTAATVTDACVLRGWQAVLYRMALAATRSAADLECAIFLSTRILCDPATAHGQGNERPCCTHEWTQALLRGLPLRGVVKGSSEHKELDDRFVRLVHANRRYQLGFVLILSNTLRMLASGHVEGQRLCAEHTELFTGIAQGMVPAVASYVEELMRESALHAVRRTDAGSAAPLPSRLTVELNHLVVHSVHWLTTDVLLAHMDAEADSSVDAKEAALKSRRQKKRPPVLDRDLPACLWGCVTMVRNALRRGLRWLVEEFDHRGSRTAVKPATALLSAVSKQLEDVFTDVVKHQELLQCSLLNAMREFNGAASHNARSLTEMVWAHTLQMCFLVRNLTGVWVAVHGGLGVSTASAGLVLPAYRDVLMFMASALLRVPALQDAKENERTTFMATDAALSACLALVAAAPTTTLQAELWATDSGVTQQIHALLVQRALRYRSERVLRLASLLSRAVLDAAVRGGALAGFAADSSDQLLELLESEDDAASRCVSELLCVSILEHPYRLIPALFRMLEHGSTVTRRHVLEVLCSLPDLVSEQRTAEQDTAETHSSHVSASDTVVPWPGGHSKSIGAHRRNVLRLLAENLLLRLSDEELCLRLLSSSLFAKVHPDDVLLPLLNLCLQRDDTGRKQGAALSALTSLVTAHTSTAETYLLLLQCGYQCLAAANGGTFSALVAPEGVKMATDGGDSEQSPTKVRRPTPQTPGDILSQALLYSADGIAGSAHDVSSTPAAMSTTVVEMNASSSDAHAGQWRRKEAQLQTALLTLTDRWVRVAAASWTYACHSLPLFQFLTRQAKGGAGDGTTDHASDSGAPADEWVQWVMKYTLRLTASLTGLFKDDLSSTDQARLNTMHLRAIWDTFFACASATEGPPDDRWTRIACRAGGTGSGGDADASARLHAVLLPLLCLRSCAPKTFAVADATFVTDAVESPAEGDEDGDVANIVRRLWRVLWRGATTEAQSDATIFAAYPEIHRVALEVVCRFPARLFFGAWTRWAAAHAKETEASDALSSLGDELSVSRLFAYRVYLFGVSSYLAAASVQTASRHSDPSASTAAALSADHGSDFASDLQVVLDYRATLERLLNVTLPHWLMEKEGDISVNLPSSRQGGSLGAAGEAGPRIPISQGSSEKAEAMRQRLCVAAVDAAAVVGVVTLAKTNGFPTSSSPPTPGNGYTSVLYALCNSLLATPLTGLAKAYRDAEKREMSKELPRHDNASRETDWTWQLTRFQLCLHIHECMLNAISLHPTHAKGLLLCWFRGFLRPIVELSNAACRSVVGRELHECRAAVDACSVIFQAVLLARKVGSPAAPALTNSAEDKSSASSSLLFRLAWEEREALVSFSLGCVRFTASAAVQIVGVRLLSALLVAAPELFLSMEGLSTQTVTSAPSPRMGSSASPWCAFEDEQRLLSSAASALQSIALMHPDRPTRVLADEVLRMLEKAATASGT
ncbi:conserved hypothetical protein [Leishmania major strain Friedlin]|uniref:Uncharacterized protein n=1 Tax=Leishmania major TaxID=5664 RepID=Q4Q2Y2_LEIMA|nr:conserved hypothetical protein [Leishmania major strain Friedlin]CAG9582090.1 hypothetical_protein_-_conserved [Leishmania major strain Friedlin]CAJ07931.1 conserved hypothetical protein [Leishmania major strain Friedlin]|eukprot:XP_001686316.1 conserved hypothetical protein [Leishmania major strain Friedlin]